MAAEPPVLPGSDEARRWAVEELSKSEYREAAPGWLEGLWRMLTEWLRSLDSFPGVDGSAAAPLIGVGIAVVIGIAIILARPRLNARSRPSDDVFDADATWSASDYRGRAAAAASAGEWGAAVVDCFRALVRTAEDRNVLDTRPGRTADEVARELAGPFGSEARRLAWAARTFDGIRYGNEATDRDAYAAVMELDTALQSLKPLNAALPAEPAVPR
ncbi:DUF4129 domain-containing protein [Arthrobacter sp. ISL-48]|uniref:DUF4129 domain-containing protein n=1 Tax=Arthrobacter sp. ISL-48 TaxID=2819110 RepID=UPI001BE7CDA8|nr:DUF4129 domain-containing protein [Arthrobacter sp. ISL-48]MBT2531877.1 DUF4129 domain-containing protein [Arthrobacter sp. ISL-48]